MPRKILVTGNKSGLGRYLYENLGGLGFDRDNFNRCIKEIRQKGSDVIIHCAFNPAKDIDTKLLYSYLYDNVLLTRELVSLLHKKFIFISTVEVYPKKNVIHTEKEGINVSLVGDLYAFTKLMSEVIIMNNCPNYLILRPSAFLGRYSRKNSLIKILDEESCSLTLTSNSRFNYVLHSDMLNFIQFAIKDDLKGIYNIASSKNISLSEVAEMSSIGAQHPFGRGRPGIVVDVLGCGEPTADPSRMPERDPAARSRRQKQPDR